MTFIPFLVGQSHQRVSALVTSDETRGLGVPNYNLGTFFPLRSKLNFEQHCQGSLTFSILPIYALAPWAGYVALLVEMTSERHGNPY